MANLKYKVQIETKKNNGNSIINHAYTSDEFPDVGTAVIRFEDFLKDYNLFLKKYYFFGFLLICWVSHFLFCKSI